MVLNLFHIIFKRNSKARFVMTLEVLLWDLKDVVPFHFKVATGNHSHSIRTSRSKVVAIRSTTTGDLKPSGGISKSQMGNLCLANPR